MYSDIINDCMMVLAEIIDRLGNDEYVEETLAYAVAEYDRLEKYINTDDDGIYHDYDG